MEDRIILLVEDNPDDEHLFLYALRKVSLGASVIVAHDGLEALEKLDQAKSGRKQSSKVVAVFLDLKMPRMDGLEMLARYQEKSSPTHPPIVVFTSSSQEKDILESYRLGAASYVRKPIDADAYASTVRDIVHYWIDINQPAAAARVAPVSRVRSG